MTESSTICVSAQISSDTAFGKGFCMNRFESVINLLSFATIRKERGEDWLAESMRSLGGIVCSMTIGA